MYTHVLCAVDFSDLAQRAAERAAAIQRLTGARLTLLHVVEYFPGERSNKRIAPEDIDPMDYESARALERLERTAASLDGAQAGTRVLVCENAAWHKILELADSEQVDLIVLGRHGLHGVAALLGATAGAVQQRARCDVLTVCHLRA